MVSLLRVFKPLLVQIAKPHSAPTILVAVRRASIVASRPIQDNISSLQLKKRTVRKKRPPYEDLPREAGIYDIVAFATAEEYDLEALTAGLKHQDLYEPGGIENNPDVVHAVAKYQVDQEPREIFFFREGSVVLWNTNDLESSNVLSFLKKYEQDGYAETVVYNECECMSYKHQEEG